MKEPYWCHNSCLPLYLSSSWPQASSAKATTPTRNFEPIFSAFLLLKRHSHYAVKPLNFLRLNVPSSAIKNSRADHWENDGRTKKLYHEISIKISPRLLRSKINPTNLQKGKTIELFSDHVKTTYTSHLIGLPMHLQSIFSQNHNSKILSFL